jgi:ATP-dependent Clp protease protease subunit
MFSPHNGQVQLDIRAMPPAMRAAYDRWQQFDVVLREPSAPRLSASKAGKNAEMLIYDEIGAGWFGGGIAAVDFNKQLQALKLEAGDTLKVRINSPGGNMFDGFAIHNYLRTSKAEITVVVDGVAASAASMIAMAGDVVEMPANSMLMIHNPWMFVVGDHRVMRKAADDIEKMRDSATTSYLRKTGDKLSREDLLTMLDEETWLSAEDSVRFGLADKVDEPVRPSAKAIATPKQSLLLDHERHRAKLRALIAA